MVEIAVCELTPSAAHLPSQSGESTFDVSSECIGCKVCCGIAPRNFQIDCVSTMAHVTCQPRSGLETSLCVTAEGHCPVGAIFHR